MIHVGSFCDFLSFGSALKTELCAAVTALEQAMEINWMNIWIETD